MNNIQKSALIIDNICGRIEPGKKVMQKLFYLMERKGVDLNLNYSIHFFGPYSSRLDNILHSLQSNGVIEIDTSGTTHKIKMIQGDILDHIFNDDPQSTLSEEEQTKVDDVLDCFYDKSALDLEAITTIDYVATVLLQDNFDETKIIEEVMKIKKDKFNKKCLQSNLAILKDTGMLVCETT